MKIFFFILLVLDLIFLNISDCGAEEISTLTKKYGFSLPANLNLNIVKNDFHESNGKIIQFIILNNQQMEIEINIIGPMNTTAINKLIKVEYDTLKRLYSSAETPYKGAITKEIKCDPNLVPRQKSFSFLKNKVDLFIAKATTRKAFGVCTKEESEYDGAFLAIKLPSESLLKIKVFHKQNKSSHLNEVELIKILQGFKKTK